MEACGDWFTGAAGPVFVTIAWVLIGGGVVVFFGVIAPRLPLRLLTIPICLLLAANLLGHYHLACSVPPGFSDEVGNPTAPKSMLWAPRRTSARHRLTRHVSPPTNGHAIAEEGHSERLSARPRRERKCKKCGGVKFERTHHCRICRRDVLKYDHHCPWINQCVGINNERHFILFMVYFVFCCSCFVALGYPYLMEAFNFFGNWPYWPQRTPFIMIYILAAVLGLAVLVMVSWHLRLVMMGETTVEGQDNDVYRKTAKQRGEEFVNCYDLGWRQNLALFFNLDEYPLYAIALPLRVTPYSDGRTWTKREGYSRHGGVQDQDEMTDEED